MTCQTTATPKCRIESLKASRLGGTSTSLAQQILARARGTAMTTASVRNFPRTASRGNDRVDDPNSRPLKPELVEVSPEQQKLALLMEYIGKVIKLGDKPVFQIKDYRKAGFPDFCARSTGN